MLEINHLSTAIWSWQPSSPSDLKRSLANKCQLIMTSDEDVAKKCRLITTNYDGGYSLQTISPVTRTKLSLIVIHMAEGHNSDFIFLLVLLLCWSILLSSCKSSRKLYVQHPRVINMARKSHVVVDVVVLHFLSCSFAFVVDIVCKPSVG